MQAIIRYPNSQRVEVVVLHVGRFSMRVIAPGSSDTTELKLDYGQWTDEAGVSIEFDSLIVNDSNRLDAALATASRAFALSL
jgi:hypothetical protein